MNRHSEEQREGLSRLIVEFYERLSAWEAAAVRGSGLSTTQNHMIEIVGHAGTIQMKDLAQMTGVTTGTLTVAVDRLEDKGLIKRVPNQADRRSYLIELTGAGREAFNRHHAAHLGLTASILEGMPETDRLVFQALIATAIQAIPGTLSRD
nr:MarR family transcriptional regulator [uncultured Holophaga sp.]